LDRIQQQLIDDRLYKIMSTPFRHRPTGGKQQNKPFKSKHSTKGQIRERTKGKIDRVSNKAVPKTAHESKEARKNKARQLAKQKREQIVQKKRLGKTNEGPPLLVVRIILRATMGAINC
jgi:pre-rRNA-processing protein TSR1